MSIYAVLHPDMLRYFFNETGAQKKFFQHFYHAYFM